MGHHQAIVQRSNLIVDEKPENIGVIYLSWHSEQSAGTFEQLPPTFMKRWKLYIEMMIYANPETAVHVRDKFWMGDDLYVVMALPDLQQQELLGNLLQAAGNWQEEAERGFSGAELGAMTDMRLHAGVGLVESSGTGSPVSRLYEASKRALLYGQQKEALTRAMRLQYLNGLIRGKLLIPVYQPIMSLQESGSERAAFGYEALTRFPKNKWFSSPLDLFAFAEESGEVARLDQTAREQAVEGSTGLQPHQKLFLNMTAQLLNEGSLYPDRLAKMMEQRGLSPHHIVFEITERSAIQDYGSVLATLAHYRRQGFQIAIDDVGAGYSSLQAIIELKPDYIKVDRSLIMGIHEHEMKEHIVHTLVQLADKMAIGIIAEGIEHQEELDKVKAMGVHYAQGYLLGRPGEIAGLVQRR
ncbi:EAL domain-containing protein [Paenibacillus sp. BIHB 4019]|uniref:EAL domain-containing protein n=1 Tax=Paenibacillus sp. BIHB 4019 TaxID=1870819 RepID=UPI0012374FD7|nr:EAL domain-containing protein [Paenibacillus sp. BIHB 4019]